MRLLLRLYPYPIARTRRTVRRSADTLTRQPVLPLIGTATLTALLGNKCCRHHYPVTLVTRCRYQVTHSHLAPLPLPAWWVGGFGGSACYRHHYPARRVTSYPYQHPYQVARYDAAPLPLPGETCYHYPYPVAHVTSHRYPYQVFGVRHSAQPPPLPGSACYQHLYRVVWKGSVPIPLPGRQEKGTKKDC